MDSKTPWRGPAVVLALMLSTRALADGLPALPQVPIPDKAEDAQFKSAPAPWRDYLIKARMAERIADPLQRCLAYPDLPANAWPAGHAEAHCRNHVATSNTLAEIERLLKAGQADVLERRMRDLLAKHAESEEIHVVISQFGAESDDAARISARWLEAAPDSAFAMTARAAFHAGIASRARGGKYAADTPRESMVAMHAHYEQAVPLYRKVLAIDPGMIDAYAGLLEAGYRDSESAWEQEGSEGGTALDAGCTYLAGIRMTSLEPRWGGSYEAMLAHAGKLEPLAARRPLLALRLSAPYGDRGDRLIAAGELDAEARDILDIAIRKGSLEDYLQDAVNVAWNAGDPAVRDRWKGLALAMQAARFSERNEWTHRIIALGLVREEPEIGLRHVRIALRQEPESAVLHYIAGALLYNSKRFADAEPYYIKATEDDEQRQASLRELVGMWMFDAGLDRKAGALKARPYLDRLLAGYPDDGQAWLYRVMSDGVIDGGAKDEVVDAFLKHADPADPRKAEAAALFRRVRAAGGPKAFIEKEPRRAKP